MASQGSWQWMTMAQKQAGHLERWDNSISMDPYTLVGRVHSSKSHNVLCMYCRSNNDLTPAFLFFSPFWLVFSTFSPWRRHERDSSSHKQTVHRRLIGLCVTLYTLHWLPLSAGGGCCWRQEHQHLLQLDNGSNTWRSIFSTIFNWSEHLGQLICHLETD